MPEQIAAPAREEIEITLALGVVDVRSLSAHQRHGETAILADDVFVEDGDGFGTGHERFSSPTMSAAIGGGGTWVRPPPIAALMVGLAASQGNLRADAAVGVDFQEQRMAQSAIDD